MINETLTRLTESQLQDPYLHEIHDEGLTVAHFLVHLATHLAYHLGQVNYHRRLLDSL